MRIFLVEPYFGGSHRQWAEGYRAASSHEVHLITHDARFWKWRMAGGHVTLGRLAAGVAAEHGPPDVLLASDMLNLPAFLGATREFLGEPGVALYMHENQLTYPASSVAADDLSYAMINWASVDAADAVFFNSEFHLDGFFAALPELLGRYPDYRHSSLVPGARSKSGVLAVGIDLAVLDGVPPERSRPALILWNQRWEHDKNPAEFFAALDALIADGVEFRVALAGEVFSTSPGEFDAARERLGARLVHFGFAELDTYRRLLRSADVVVSTARHEFFGVAIIEAIYAGAWPVLPDRLAYPGHIPAPHHDRVLYADFDGLVEKLRDAVVGERESLSSAVGRYDWSEVVGDYDSAMESLVK